MASFPMGPQTRRKSIRCVPGCRSVWAWEKESVTACISS